MTSRARSTPEQREKWLADHPEIAKLDKPAIVRALKAAGLLAPTTYAGDVRIKRFTDIGRTWRRG
jgi:hypothetical protein